MARSLVIVESATKAPTINRYLGRDYIVKSSAGHVRDLPVGGRGSDAKTRAEERAKEAAKTRALAPEKKAEYRRQRTRDKLVQRMGGRPQQRLEGVLRGHSGQGKGGSRATPARGARRCGLSRDRLGPRRRGHCMASHRSARRAAGALSPRGVQRDHQECRRGGVRQPQPSRSGPRQRPAGAPLPRSRWWVSSCRRCCGRNWRAASPLVACSPSLPG